jgi:hypothetical protein
MFQNHDTLIIPIFHEVHEVKASPVTSSYLYLKEARETH